MSRPVAALVAAVALTSGAAAGTGPTLTGLFPAGASRGQAATVTASGSFDRWPVRGWVEGEGVCLRAREEKGTLEVRVADDAEPGLRWVRLYDEEGASGLRPFVVGTLPEVVEVEPNDDPRRPQALAGSSATVNGRLARPGDVDGFAVELKKGRTLVADVEASRHLGSPMDAVLQVVGESGSVLAQNDDAVGRDPRIVFEAPADGAYVVRLFAFPATPDSSIRFAGGAGFLYRLTLTTGGFLDFGFPLAVPRDEPGPVAAVGVNVPEASRLLTLSGDRAGEALRGWHPRLAGTAEVRVVAGSAGVEAEINDPDRPQEIPDRGAVSGRIDPPGDRDAYQIALKKGEKRVVRVESRALGLAMDPVLRLTDAAGKTLAEADDVGGGRDAEVAVTAPSDGAYRAIVRDLNGRGGPRSAYLLRVVAPEPDFALTLAADRFDAPPGKAAKVAVTIERREGFAGAVEVVAEGLPAGVTAGPAVSKAGDGSARSVSLTLSAGDDARPGSFRVVGRAEGIARPRVATAPIAGFGARTDRPWLSVGRRPGSGKP